MSFLAPQRYDRSQVTVGNYDSLYDSLYPGDDIASQHFVEWFSGSALDAIWTFTNYTGSGTGVMDDAVDGGYKITTGALTNSSSAILFNDKRQYDPAAHVCIRVIKIFETTDVVNVSGITNDDAAPWNDRVSFFVNTGTNSFFNLITTSSGTSTTVASSISLDTNWHKARTEGRASSAILHLDDTLEAVSTSNLTALKCQPYVRPETLTTASRSTAVRYMEVYNT